MKQDGLQPWRKGLYYLGLALVVLGVMLFLISFLSAIFSFGKPMDLGGGLPTGFALPFVGIVLAIIGGFMRHVGARGLAGSGMVLDPEQAREDLHPYTHMAGGMVKDAVKGFREAAGDKAEAKEIVKVRCQNCRALNDEEARFCNQCGQGL